MNTQTAAYQKIEQFKQEIDFDESLSGIIELSHNVNEGTARAAEIVRALRTFSRLDEDEQKRTDIHQNVDTTLSLLHSQYKDTITVKKEYGDIPSGPNFW